ncbi:hypothetical protein PLESTB_000753100 [Pleodorina starrii]|uniref:U-box domain-containing protein n=1 Tax=Pleodorina starrii TaxID=330485 RepID=A0A9W6BKD4_9CHLO|nr:hypothetical protein PLESTM_001568700 [Pleodorina starrii]GLC53468.1 hypothetical protein PLESTB_000753100 [Pleodorina starrii]GLC69796.1 hypothetical protein PLESTF_000881500 [Pleodorina starrii]
MGNFVSTADAAFTPSDAFFLCEAARTGAVDIVRLFLRKNFALVSATNASDKNTPWHVAAAAGHDVIVRVLIDTTRANAVSNNFDPISKVINKQNAKGQTPLMLACGGGHSVCVRLLLESGAHLLVADTMGQSALHYAALHWRADGKGNDCVELLLGHMQQQLIAQGPVAAPPGVHANVIRKFADAGDMYGRTALHCAAWSGNTRAAHALWAVGADICSRTEADCYDAELPCNNGTTPLHYAAMRGHQPLAVLLLAAWHRMATRPSAPLPRPAYFDAALAAGKAAAGKAAAAAAARGAGGHSARDLEPTDQQDEEGPREQGHQGSSAAAAQNGAADAVTKGPQETVEAAAAAEGREQMAIAKEQQHEKDKEAKAEERGDGDGEARDTDQGRVDSGAAGAVAAVGGAAAYGASGPGTAQGPTSGEQGPAEGEGALLTADGPAEEASAAAGLGPAGEQGASARASEAGDGVGSSGGSRRSSSAGSMDGLLEVPQPPLPRPPAIDPRLMVDAYGMTPYTIAGKRKHERGSMLLELLDPTTDFGAGSSDSESDGDDDEEEEDGSGGGSTSGGVAAAAARRRRPGRRGRRRPGSADKDVVDDDDDEDDDDADSEAAAAGPLLLWEGVELVRDIAADPEGFFRMQRTVALLQPQHQDQDDRAGEAEGGGGHNRGGGGRSRLPPATCTTTDIVPDCFLCPLTCEVFRDPVVAADGVTYEREAIESHLRHVHTSPVTKQRLPSKQLYDNKTMKSAVRQWAAGLLPPPGATSGGGGGSREVRRGAGGTGLIGRP